jgi:hypothetical protein
MEKIAICAHLIAEHALLSAETASLRQEKRAMTETLQAETDAHQPAKQRFANKLLIKIYAPLMDALG